MTPEQIKCSLQYIGMSEQEFADFMEELTQNVENWIHGREPVTAYVELILETMVQTKILLPIIMKRMMSSIKPASVDPLLDLR
jgi:DNA-binding transcriptional regulator YiaG